MSDHPQYQVAVVGAGVSGAAAAYHLAQRGVRVLILEAGKVGIGRDDTHAVASHAVIHGRLSDEDAYEPHHSGTAVFPEVPAIKMMVNLFPAKVRDFIRHHGNKGAATYLKLSAEGIRIQRSLAHQLLPDPSSQITEKGTVYVCEEGEQDELKEEFQLLKELGADVQWMDRREMEQMHGPSAGFAAGIFFPNDCVIDSSTYARALIRAAVATGLAAVEERCSPVVLVETSDDNKCALVTHANGERRRFDHAVVATGGFYYDRHLSGILRPCWSYLVALPSTPNAPTSTPNFFTWGFAYDWCMAHGAMRVSGEDHFSALKPPRSRQRCANLAHWAVGKYPNWLQPITDEESYPSRHGVYSETPDHLPLLGTPSPAHSRVCYLVGCNAWGQASLSLSASLVPGLLGYGEPLTGEQREMAELLSIRRFVRQGVDPAAISARL